MTDSIDHDFVRRLFGKDDQPGDEKKPENRNQVASEGAEPPVRDDKTELREYVRELFDRA